jgi:hypothetical protein
MSKKSLVLIWFAAFTLVLSAQESIPLISEIGMIESESDSGTTPPRQMIIGVEVTRDVLYKLFDERGVLKGGQFLRGFNSFGIDVGDRFEHAGSCSYTLELKYGSRVFRKSFTLDIRIDEPQVIQPQPDEDVIKRENIVSMYVGNRLIVSNRKLYTSELSKKIQEIPRPYNIDPYDSAAEPSVKDLQGVPILEALAAAAGVIKGLFSKKDDAEPPKPVRKKSVITKRFIRNDPERGEITVTAVISLRTEPGFF